MSTATVQAPVAAPSAFARKHPVEALFLGRAAYTLPATLVASGGIGALAAWGVAALTSGGKPEVAHYTFAFLVVPAAGLVDALIAHSPLGRALRERAGTALHRADGQAPTFYQQLGHSLLKAVSLGLFAPAFIGAMSGEADLWHNRASGMFTRLLGR